MGSVPRTHEKQQDLGGRRGCVTARWSKIIGRNLVLVSGILFYRKQPLAFCCWEPFPKTPLWRGRGAWTRPSASQQRAPSASVGLPCAPPEISHWPTGRTLMGPYLSQKLSDPLFFLPNVLLCRKILLPPPSWQLVTFQPQGYWEKAAWRGDAAHVSFLSSFSWGEEKVWMCLFLCPVRGTVMERGCAWGEQWHSQAERGTCSLLVARASLGRSHVGIALVSVLALVSVDHGFADG